MLIYRMINIDNFNFYYMKKEILKWIIISISFSVTTLLTMVWYAAWVSNLWWKNTWDVVTAQTWNDLVNNVESLNSSYIPSWAIMAFNLSSCPSWWTEFTQAKWKTLVGVWNWTDINSYSTWFTLLQQWGEYRHTLNISEIPSHNHWWAAKYSWYSVNPNSWWSSLRMQFEWNWSNIDWLTIQSQWWDQSHNNIQPYVAILYCTKN